MYMRIHIHMHTGGYIYAEQYIRIPRELYMRTIDRMILYV